MQLNEEQIDALQEVVNIGVGRAAAVLNSMLESHISLNVPHIEVIDGERSDGSMSALGDGMVSSVHLGFSGAFSGIAALVFPVEAASKLVSVVADEDDADEDDLDALRVGTLEEVGNIVINGVMGAITNVLGDHMEYAVPQYREDRADALFGPGAVGFEAKTLIAHTHFRVESLDLSGSLVLVFEVKSFDNLIHALEHSHTR